MSNPPTRRTQPVIKVRPLPDERRALMANAAAANLPLSAYLLVAGLGATIRSVVDLHHVSTLAAAHSDLGRLGGLLKLWLTSDRLHGAHAPDRPEIIALFQSIKETQGVLRDAARCIVDDFSR